MKKRPSFTVILVMCLPFYISSCSNAPKTETTLSDTAKNKDTIALVKNDTATIASVAKTENPPPPPPTILEMRAVRKEDYPDETPPPYEDERFNSDPMIPTASDPGPVGIGPDSDSKIHTVVDQMPEMHMLTEFLYENLIYPVGPRDMGIQGVVKIGFVVDINGRVSNNRIIKTSGNPELDQEAMRVIRLTSGKWKPGKINGKSVKTQMTLPITFQIDE
jgi:protein TonB